MPPIELKQWQADLGLSEAAMAHYLGIPYPTLSAWFNRGGRPSTEACEKIAARLSLPMATVLRMAGHP
jgi:DNA-binding transcriptional regulator YiaG